MNAYSSFKYEKAIPTRRLATAASLQLQAEQPYNLLYFVATINPYEHGILFYFQGVGRWGLHLYNLMSEISAAMFVFVFTSF